MKINDVRLTPLFSKFKQPYVWAIGADLGQTTILVEIETESGVTGIGATAPTTHRSGRSQRAATRCTSAGRTRWIAASSSPW